MLICLDQGKEGARMACKTPKKKLAKKTKSK